MFARTPRLLLRPGFAGGCAGACRGDCRRGDRPQPRDRALALPHARRRGLSRRSPRDPVLPSLLIFERTDGAPRLVGACGLGRRPSGAVELGYWIARALLGPRASPPRRRAALVDIARTLGLTRSKASHFLDNPASGRVLEKLGFEPLGIIAPRMSCARGAEYAGAADAARSRFGRAAAGPCGNGQSSLAA